MKRLFVVVCLLVSIQLICAQELKHKVSSGETVYGIAKKYKVKEKDIFDANPSIKEKPLAIGKVLTIPVKEDQSSVLVVPQTHTIAKGDSFYSIARKYQLKVSDLQLYNPDLKAEDLKIGDVVKLKSDQYVIADEETGTSNNSVVEIPDSNEEDDDQDLIHEVEPKETLYRIAKKYHTSVKELKKLNPEVKRNLPIGYHLIIRKGESSISTTIEEIAVVPEEKEDIVSETGNEAEVSDKATILISKASGYLGVRYRSGGTTTAGFDCSGLMCTTFREVDMELPRSSYEMARYGFKVDKTEAQKGDLIFFYTTSKSRISHVGMITEVTDHDIKFIHSSTSSGVTISSLSEAYYKKRFAQISRVLN
ncbi:LysM peptidoglycan-binding domain-containing protein [Flavobacterium sp. NRK F10]|uniref:C40 family peptidase n=1 Tax=Flavobacterium sp. NRK F10 TaxID=2954931 RepID=UPI0020918492|nr:C40 family peptidase [Flavobacterium sp. NRK F10]MCO6175678.1 LysM peptidoglycan-binding domain-containing protein [Flavobacterium sp. NRK F10]